MGDWERDAGAWRAPDDESDEAWRGTAHVGRWPEELAGPEYWAYRDREDVERAVSELVGERTAPED